VNINRLFSGILWSIFLLTISPDFVFAGRTTAADEIVLNNGSLIYGKIISARDHVITVDTEFAGIISVKSSAIQSMQTQGSLTIQVADGTIIRDKPIKIEDEIYYITNNGGEQLSYNVDEILRLNPEPWELGEGYKWNGLVSFAWSLQRGNSDTDELDYRLNSSWRNLQRRFTLKLDGELDKTNNVKNADNWQVLGKYDRFVTDDTYWGSNLSLEKDEFSDLDLRSYFGPYYGKQWFNMPAFSLSSEGGLVYVDENFMEAENKNYTGANWNILASSNYLGEKTRLYLDHTGVWDLDDTSDIILNLTLGLAFPMLNHLEAAAEILMEYDSGAVEGVDEMDQTYQFRVGYNW